MFMLCVSLEGLATLHESCARKAPLAAEVVCLEGSHAAFRCLLESRALNKIDPLRMPCFRADVEDFRSLPDHVETSLDCHTDVCRLNVMRRQHREIPSTRIACMYLKFGFSISRFLHTLLLTHCGPRPTPHGSKYTSDHCLGLQVHTYVCIYIYILIYIYIYFSFFNNL